MEVIQMGEKIRVLLTEEEVDRKIEEIGKKISEDYEGKDCQRSRGGSQEEVRQRLQRPVS